MGVNAGLRLFQRSRRASSSSAFSFLPPSLAGAVIAGSTFLADQSADNDEHDADDMSTYRTNNCNLASNFHQIVNSPQILATSSSAASSSNPSLFPDVSKQQRPNGAEKADAKMEEYDFIVVGNGNAGQSAVRTIRRLCPTSTIAIIDPKLAAPSYDGKANANDDKMATYMQQAVTGLNHTQRTIKLTDGSNVHFRQSILIATGARGSPPPSSLVDDRAMSRILELRSTEAFASTPSSSSSMQTQRRPVMPPEGVRQMTLLAASQGANICVMGSSVEALELAAAAAQASNGNGNRRKGKGDTINTSADDETEVTMIFGGAGVLSTRLPRYLSTAVAKRLRQHGIDVQSRSLVRYVAMNNYHNQQEECEVHTAKSYDTMDTRRTRADLVVLAPSVGGQRGTAVIPIAANMSSSSFMDKLPSAFTPWSSLSPALNCYVDDGRIVVNSELNAASRIYAAGSVAKHPSPDTGHAAVSGEGITDATLAGEVAAHNMAREYYERSSSSSSLAFSARGFGGSSKSEALQSPRLFSSESCPIWRTDIGTFGTLEGSPSSLSVLGVNALCVGNCDSETMATHGFFYTNQTADSRRKNTLARMLTRGKARETDEGSVLARRRSTRRSSTMRRSVYGSGVVFYLDRSGAIRGIMTWGLPFTTVNGDGKSTLNAKLVSRMKEIIRTNGEITKACHKEAVLKRDARIDTSLLSSYHLSEESKLLVSIALSSSTDSTNGGSSQPLHRYVPSKPAGITGIGMLKRREEIGTGGVGEDLFARVQVEDCSEDDRPPSLVHVYPMNWSSGPDSSRSSSIQQPQASSGNSDDSRGSDMAQEQMIDYEAIKKAKQVAVRSRPPKEDPLWMREGDTSKSISMNDVLTDVFLMQVRRGRFQDGTDSVKQAPSPKIIQDAKAKLKEWTSSGVEEAEEELGIKDDEAK